jgi:hypothetical protein
MRKFKNGIFYIGVTGGFIALMFWIVTKGKSLEIGRNVIAKTSNDSLFGQFLNSLIHNLKHPLAILLLQIITIIIVARFFGWIFRKIGQPSVIGEIIAGIFLGPSVVGMYMPEYSAMLFPIESLRKFTVFKPNWINSFHVCYRNGARFEGSEKQSQ